MRRTTRLNIDMWLFLCVLILVGVGIAAIYTASYPRADAEFDSYYHYVARQAPFALLGFALMLVAMSLPMEWLRRSANAFAVLALILLVLVLLIGAAKHGNRAWIPVLGAQFQPSELAKVAVVLALAAFMARRPWMVKTWAGLVRGPVWFLLVPVCLVAAQGDLGTVLVMAAGILVLLQIGGMPMIYVAVPAAGIGVLLLGVLLLGPVMGKFVGEHRAARVQAWLNPFASTLPEAHQPRHSLIAIGSGGAIGRGFCDSREKWFYLPGAHNDYILAIIAEEVGFFGTLLLVFVPCGYLMLRGFAVARTAPDEFSALLAAGCTAMITVQALINMAVVLNVIPSMGITLPFISYGGTSLIASMLMAGLLLNVARLQTAPAPAEEPAPAPA
jgi:cell division protein FtsW